MSSFLRARIPTLLRTPFHTARAFTTSTPLSNLARMQIIGRLGGQPEPTQTASGRTLLRYAVATNYGPRDNRETSWFNVTSFEEDGPRRDLLASLEKGTLVYVEAESQMRTYQGEDGKMHKALNLIQRNLQVLSRPNRDRAGLEDADEGASAASASG